MHKRFGIFLIFVGVLGLGLFYGGDRLADNTKQTLTNIFADAQSATTLIDWQKVIAQGRTLPAVPQIRRIKKSFSEAELILKEIENITEQIGTLQATPNIIPWGSVDTITTSTANIESHLKHISYHLSRIRPSLLSQTEQARLQQVHDGLNLLRSYFHELNNFNALLQRWHRDESSVIILLQNQNEVRPTGGFVGSFFEITFTQNEIQYAFQDIYALDRLIETKDQLPAPAFFHDLSQTISLRDANFWADFPTSAEVYQGFISEIDGKQKPDAIIALNLHLIGNLLSITGPIKLDPWDVTLDQDNFDLVLSFLVESKVSGRYDVKAPVMIFAQHVLREIFSESPLKLLQFDWPTHAQYKNILGYSSTSTTQHQFENWNIDGALKVESDADNYLLADLISIGANKTDKFVWTRLTHDSQIHPDGRVVNSLQIVRNHTLQPDMLPRLLGYNTWSENIRNLLDGRLRWVLGEGQNRTILRLHVPVEAKLITTNNPSGEVQSYLSEDQQFQIFEIPLFVSMGERLVSNIEYETSIDRGSSEWRPYHLQLLGTPGRDKSKFLSTISPVGGEFLAETDNVGLPVDLIDQSFRSVVEFK